MTTNSAYKTKCTETKLASKLNIKVKTSKNFKQDLCLKAQSPEINFDATYIGDIGKWFLDHIVDNYGRDKKLHLLEHAQQAEYEYVNLDILKIFFE